MIYVLRVKGCPPPKIVVQGYPKRNGRGLDPCRFKPFVDDDDVPQSNDSFETIRTDVPLSSKPSIPQSNVHLLNEPVLTNIPQSNELFQTIPTNVPLSNKPSISQSSIHLSNEPVLANVPPSNEPMLTKFPLLIEPKPILGQTKTSDPVGLQYILGIPKETWSNLYIPMSKYGVAYTNHVKSWNNIIIKVRDLPIHVLIEELHRIYSGMSYTYREEAEKSQVRLTPWAMDHCEGKKFVAGLVTCKVHKSCHHFQMTSYGRTGSVNIEDGTCSCHWWKMMGIPCEHGVRALGLANVDPTARVSEYFTNNIYKDVYEPIWIPIRGIEQWIILKTDPCVRAPISIV
ncbi:hypothetical protein GIB67_001423 [Kingdonia uniflora]|uniref:SWIM-type domain-containing protein n=1 Tax=Kingdonia uniflora TaxID=39325 RepID=A0A7J7LYT1_9MAGN|nr:hypothetical protein GIB67_001423 [Kingdonia uniflora]